MSVIFTIKEIFRDQLRAFFICPILYYLIALPTHYWGAGEPNRDCWGRYCNPEAIFQILHSFLYLGKFLPTLIAAFIYAMLIGPIIYFWGRKPELDKYPMGAVLAGLFIVVYGIFLFVECSDISAMCVKPL